MKKKMLVGLAMGLFMCGVAATTQAGTIIVNNDEWTLSDTGFANAPDNTEQFVSNMASFFSSGGVGSFHAYSTNFSYTGSSFSTILSDDGHAYTTGTGFAFTPTNISGFDAIFLGGTYLSSTEITTVIDYVNSGGNVYLAGGTGIGGAATEATAWNPFLNTFGMSFASSYNGIVGNINVSSATHPIFEGVSELYQASGNSIVGAGVEISFNGQGLYATANTSTVPIPATFFLFGSSLAILAGLRIKTRKQQYK